MQIPLICDSEFFTFNIFNTTLLPRFYFVFFLCQLGAYNAKLFTDFSVIDRFVKDLEVITIVSSKLYLCHSLSLPETT